LLIIKGRKFGEVSRE